MAQINLTKIYGCKFQQICKVAGVKEVSKELNVSIISIGLMFADAGEIKFKYAEAIDQMHKKFCT